MAIFQKSVVEKFLSELEESVIDSAYSRFKEVYSVSRISEIKTLKEEQYQEGFVRDIFAKVLGYTLQPESNYNIELEKKNETDSKKADGAILKDGNVIGVIELKDNKTKSLDKVKDQAFGYKVNHKGCKYVITSNFQKLRLYVDDATEYEEFDLYSLDREEFARFYLFLGKESLIDKNLTDELKEQTKFHEEDISKQLYKDYSSFKNKFFNNIVKNNPQFDKLLLFKKSQKFLDRILFILFSEDKKLIPENAIARIVESWEKADDLHYKPLYELFKILFTHLNKGHKYKSGYEIPAYNGGLFIADEVLDNITVDDEILKEDLLILSKYDYNTEVDVNILGHIFEHSLSELEQIEAQIKGEVADANKGKRKKDGVFYTPKYITKYIVDNTIGKLCNEKKEKLNIGDFDLSEYQNKNGKVNTKGKILFNVLEDYKKWLFGLKILDPACGSGAFLNQALTLLIEEHKFIDDLIAELTNTPLRLFDTDKKILEKNIFGVDINDESVEIAKLSLWLRTAQKGRKLSNLSNNIKCGNSLISDVNIVGAKAFDWQKEFPEVFAKGGFDVVIGNPPYVKRQNLEDENIIAFLEEKYQSATYNFDLYLLFIEMGSKLLNSQGLLSYINPSKFSSTKTGTGIREFLETNCHILKYVDFKEYQVFEDVTTYCCILILQNGAKSETEFLEINELTPYNIDSFKKTYINIKTASSGIGWQFKDTVQIKGDIKIKDICSIFTGIETGADNVFIIHKSEPIIDLFKQEEYNIVHPILKGTNANRYFFDNVEFYGIVPYDIDKQLIDEEDMKMKYPKVWDYLFSHNIKLRERDKGRMDSNKWYGYVYPKNLHKFNTERIIWSDISIRPQFSIDNEMHWHVRTLCSLQLNEKGVNKGFSLNFLLGILNSKLLHYFVLNNSNKVRGGYLRYRPQYLKEFALPNLIDENIEKKVIGHVEQLQIKNKELNFVIKKFIDLLSSELSLDKLNKKLENWHNLDWSEFEKELKNKKINLLGVQKEDWYDRFTRLKEKALSIKDEIEKTDKQIDQMVYKLYDLSEDEIKMIQVS